MFGRWLAFRRRQRQKLRASNRPPLMTAPEPDDEQLENYLVALRIMQRTVSVPGAVTVVALAGGTLLGMLRALLAIPAAAGLLLLYEEVLVPRQRRV